MSYIFTIIYIWYSMYLIIYLRNKIIKVVIINNITLK